jgi:hypothetical protein
MPTEIAIDWPKSMIEKIKNPITKPNMLIKSITKKLELQKNMYCFIFLFEIEIHPLEQRLITF